jgi:hypothetical protein
MWVNIASKVNLLKPQLVVYKIINEWTAKYLNKDFVNDIVIKLLIVKKLSFGITFHWKIETVT